MNTLRTEELINKKRKTSKITTTLYALLDGFNSKLLGPHYTGREPIPDDTLDLASLALNQMFQAGQIKFMNPQAVKGFFKEIYLLEEF
jgi:hypothetical protein